MASTTNTQAPTFRRPLTRAPNPPAAAMGMALNGIGALGLMLMRLRADFE
jgi:hypothetical protein